MTIADGSPSITAEGLTRWWERSERDLSSGSWVMVYAIDVSCGQEGARIEDPDLERTDLAALATALAATAIVVGRTLVSTEQAAAAAALADEDDEVAAVLERLRDAAATQGPMLTAVDVLLLGGHGPVLVSVTAPESDLMAEHEPRGWRSAQARDSEEYDAEDSGGPDYLSRRSGLEADIATALEQVRPALLAEDALCSTTPWEAREVLARHLKPLLPA